MTAARSIPVFAFPGSGIEAFSSLWLELDHAVSWGRFDACWRREAAGRFRATDAFLRAAGDRVPPLTSPPERAFASGVSFVCHERLPVEAEIGRPGVFLIRDPRGGFEALRLRSAPEASMGDFLRAPLRRHAGRGGFPGRFPLPPADVWALFHLWMQELASSMTVVRYEDLRTDPAGEVAKIEERFGLSVDRVKLRTVLESPTLVRRRIGTEAEAIWRTAFDPDARARLLGPCAVAMETFGYGCPFSDGDAKPPLFVTPEEEVRPASSSMPEAVRSVHAAARAGRFDESRSRLEGLARVADAAGDLALLRDLGLALACARAAAVAVPGEPTDEAEVAARRSIRRGRAFARALDVFLGEDREPSPLVDAWAAGAWTRDGRPEMARALLGAMATARPSAAERLELGREHLRVGDVARALALRDGLSADPAATAAPVGAVFRRLAESGVRPWVAGHAPTIERISGDLYRGGGAPTAHAWKGIVDAGAAQDGLRPRASIDGVERVPPGRLESCEGGDVLVVVDPRKPGEIPGVVRAHLGPGTTVICAIRREMIKTPVPGRA